MPSLHCGCAERVVAVNAAVVPDVSSRVVVSSSVALAAFSAVSVAIIAVRALAVGDVVVGYRICCYGRGFIRMLLLLEQLLRLSLLCVSSACSDHSVLAVHALITVC